MSRTAVVRRIAVLGATLSVSVAAHAGLISEWQFENNLNDSVGPNNGAVIGTVSYGAGHSGSGLVLNSDGSMVVANAVAGGLQTPTGFTIAAWIRRDSTSTGPGTGSVMNLRTVANNAGFTLEEHFGAPDEMLFAVNTSGTTSYDQISVGGWQQGQLYHIAASFDAANHMMKIYRDGVLVGSQASTGTTMMTDATNVFNIGENIANNSRWIGMIDDARYYNTVLTDQEVAGMVPEPVSILSFAAGLGLLTVRRRRR